MSASTEQAGPGSSTGGWSLRYQALSWARAVGTRSREFLGMWSLRPDADLVALTTRLAPGGDWDPPGTTFAIHRTPTFLLLRGDLLGRIVHDDRPAFFMGVGSRPELAVELASAIFELRDTPRSRSLLARALREAAVDATSSPASHSPMAACISTEERSYSNTSEVA